MWRCVLSYIRIILIMILGVQEVAATMETETQTSPLRTIESTFIPEMVTRLLAMQEDDPESIFLEVHVIPIFRTISVQLVQG